jgi:hypothetical protein
MDEPALTCSVAIRVIVARAGFLPLLGYIYEALFVAQHLRAAV